MSADAALRMAGDLAAQFRHLPEEDAAERIAGHIKMFWEPRIRLQLRSQVDAGPDPCDPVVRRVADLLGVA